MNYTIFRQLVALIVIIPFIGLSGCASIVSQTIYPISINSTPSGAKITVKDKKGMDVYLGNTPAYFKLKSGAGFFSKASYTVTFEMDGYEKRIVPIEFKLNEWYFGNIIFGGLLGFLIIDPATGAMWRLETRFLNERLTKTSASNDTPSLEVYCYNDIPESWKSKLIRVN